ncbi:MAG: alpha/beta hydrolase [Planctomycetes bacterium]|nr:alpha/beta hydrolase [Planctomycetota bacterium]MBI3846200.1 alpha/beta hydrolase [Planctomycetota bacterium]
MLRARPGDGLTRSIARIVIALALGMALIVVALRLLLDRFVFHPSRRLDASPADYGIPFEDVTMRAEDGVALHAWLLGRADTGPVVAFFHGNAGTIADRLERVRAWVSRGLCVLLVEYRGFGRSGGKATEEGVYRDAMAAYRFLADDRRVPASRIGLFGESLGGAVAIELGTRVEVCGIAVESAFTSIRDMARSVLPWYPRIFVPNAFDSLGRVASLRAPLLVVHGTRDSTVPFEQGRRLFAAAREPKRFEAVNGAEHNDVDIVGARAYADLLASFFRDGCR